MATRASSNGIPGAIEISAVVPTRNRPQHAAECAERILQADGVLELIVVDQSDDGATEEALSVLRDPRLCHVRSDLRGATNARNLGIERSRGAIIAFTDDDCRVTTDWAQRIGDIFRDDADAAVVCGRVRVPDDLRQRGFVTEFEPRVREWSGRFPPPSDWGITANLAVRREVLARVGNFDPMLGTGAPLLAGEEPDLIYRVLKAGLKVVNAREVEVDHLGVRSPGQESTKLWRAYGIGTAAALFKHVRLGDLDAAGIYLRHLGLMAGVVAGNLIRGRRPLGLRYSLAFLSGTLASFKYRIDPARRIYRPR